MAPFGVHEYLPNPVKLYTFIREPVERCISLLRFMHAHPDLNEVNRKVVSYGNNYKDMLNDKQILCFKNEQVRLISASPNWNVDENDLQTAQNRLQSFEKVVRFGDFDMVQRIW